jgi:hypothetical protein
MFTFLGSDFTAGDRGGLDPSYKVQTRAEVAILAMSAAWDGQGYWNRL